MTAIQALEEVLEDLKVRDKSLGSKLAESLSTFCEKTYTERLGGKVQGLRLAIGLVEQRLQDARRDEQEAAAMNRSETDLRKTLGKMGIEVLND